MDYPRQVSLRLSEAQLVHCQRLGLPRYHSLNLI